MIYKKSVVLTSIDNSLKKAVLNIDSRAGNIKGDVKLYNFIAEPMGVLSLGLLVDNKVHKAGLTRVGYMTYSFGSILTKIPNACTCAIVSSKGGKTEPLLLGSISSSNNLEESLLQSLGALEENKIDNVENLLNENLGEYDDQEEIETEIDKCLNCNESCTSCQYKKAFFDDTYTKYASGEQLKRAEQSITAQIPSDLKKDITKGKLRVPSHSSTLNFIDEIGGQIDMLFKDYPLEETLAEIIPNSKWVSVDFNNDNKIYVVGLIYENEVVKYVCYGVPAKWTQLPPSDFNEKAQWLPIDMDSPQGEGYWITYQDATDGNLIQVEVI